MARGTQQGMRVWIFRWLAWALLALSPVVAWPQDNAEPEITEAGEAIDQVQAPFHDIAEPGETEAPTDPESTEDDLCHWAFEDRPIQEGSQDFLRGASCHSFRWFDSLFGDTEDFKEEEVNGLALLGFEYNQYEGFDPRARFRVRASLPNISKRWDLLLGRVDEDAFISDTQGQDQTFYNPGLVERGRDDSWLLGLGHRRRGDRKGWDWSVGVRLRFPPVPYVKAQYYYSKAWTDSLDLRARQTFFWRKDDGFGTTSRADLAWGINERDVLRWEVVATASESRDGVEWYTGQTWYHLMGERTAFSFLTFATGDYDGPVAVREYGFNLIWRRPFTRDWLYLSLGPSVTWPRFVPEDKRELSLGFGAWIEMEFGNYRY